MMQLAEYDGKKLQDVAKGDLSEASDDAKKSPGIAESRERRLS
jgi:hypothetical protein